jgi:hypothetical protein
MDFPKISLSGSVRFCLLGIFLIFISYVF